MFAFGLSSVGAKPLSQEIGGIRAIVVRQLVILLLLCPVYFLIAPFRFEAAPATVAGAFALGLFGYLPVAFYYRGLRSGRVGVVSAISKAGVLVTVALSMIFLGETLVAVQWCAVLIVVLGLALLSVSASADGDAAGTPGGGVLDAFAAAGLWGIVFFALKLPAEGMNPLLCMMVIECGVLCAALIHLRITSLRLVPLSRRGLLSTATAAAGGSIGEWSYLIAVTCYPVSHASVISFSSPLVAAGLSRIILGERIALKQVLCIALVIASLIVLVAS